MTEIKKVWSCIKLALKNSWERYGSYTVWATFIGTIAVFLVKNYPNRFSQRWCDAINYWVLIIPIGLFAISFIFNLGETHSQIANLDLEWADNDGHHRLGKETTIQPLNLIPDNSMIEVVEDYFTPQQTAGQFLLNGSPPAKEFIEYIKHCALFQPLRVWLKNSGSRNVSGVKIKILVPKIDGVQVIDKYDLPQKPKGRLGLGYDVTFVASHFSEPHTDVKDTPENWQIEIHANTVQPQDEFWSSSFYVSSTTDQPIEAVAKIFADVLSKPIEVPLKIHAKVQTREMTLEDIDSDYPG